MGNNLNYEDAYQELIQISREIENEEVTVDVLANKVKRASELIEFCQMKLRSTEEQVQNILTKMGNNKI